MEKSTDRLNKILSKGKDLIGKGKEELVKILSQVKEKVSSLFSSKKVVENTKQDILETLKDSSSQAPQNDNTTSSEGDNMSSGASDMSSGASSMSSGEDNMSSGANVSESKDIKNPEGQEDAEKPWFTITENMGNLSDEELNQIGNILLNLKPGDEFARGSEGQIFKIKLKGEDGKEHEYLAAKKRFDNNLSHELKLHEAAQNILPIGNDIVRVPELKTLINIFGQDYLVMEFVEGKTLYATMMEKILQKDFPDQEWVIDTDREADIAFEKFTKHLSEADKIKAFEAKARNIKLFEPEEGKKYQQEVKEFFHTMHSKGIYHRDMHRKNVILGNNGKLYIIDFGKAIFAKDDAEAYVGHHGDEVTEKYQDDSWLGVVIGNSTYSQEDLEIKTISEKAKQRAREIEKSASIIDVLDNIPKGFLPRGMTPEDFKKEVENYRHQYGKRFNLDEFIDVKPKERKIMYFTQSIENLNELFNPESLYGFSHTKNVLQKQLSTYRADYRASREDFQKKFIKPLEKKLETITKIEIDFRKLQNFLEEEK